MHNPPIRSEPVPLEAPLRRLRLRRGFFIDDPPDDIEALHLERMRATLPHLGPGSCFARSSAALVHGLPLFSADLDRVHIVRTRGGHGSRNGVSHGYRTPQVPPDTQVVDGFPVTPLARTASDLMRRTLFGPALAVADAALRLGCDREELLAEVEKGRGCRHSTEAGRRADARSESPYESLVRAQILQAGLPLPLLQHEFSDEWGFVGRVDCYWREFDLVGEFDGEIKYTELLPPDETRLDVLARQGIRQERIERLGNRFVRWISSDVHERGSIERSLRVYMGDAYVDHGLCPEALDYRRPRNRRRP